MAFSVPLDFNPAIFMYMNPEVVVTNNLRTINDTLEWASLNDVSGFLYKTNLVPDNFDATTFLASGKESFSISDLSSNIKTSMKIEGLDEETIESRSIWINNIYRQARHMGSSVFEFLNPPSATTDLDFFVGSNVLQIGDVVAMKSVRKATREYAVVSSIDYDNKNITLSNVRRSFEDVGGEYTIYGIKVYDLERIGIINYMRNAVLPDGPAEVAAFIDTTFNADLYRLLYPKTRNLTDIEAYADYIGATSNHLAPIGKVNDLLGAVSGANITSLFPVDNLSVNYQLRLPNTTSTLTFKGVTVYGISTDDFIKSSLLTPLSAEPKLITEYAIKKYIDRSYEEQAVFNDIVINGQVLFNGPINYGSFFRMRISAIDVGYLTASSNVTISCPIQVEGPMECKSNVVNSNCSISNLTVADSAGFFCDVWAHSNIMVANTVYGPRIGIGPLDELLVGDNGSITPYPYDDNKSVINTSNITTSNMIVTKELTVGDDTTRNTQVATFNGNVLADAYDTLSDLRLKHLVRDIDPQTALQKIKKMRPVTYRVRTRINEPLQNQEAAGFIAQDMLNIVPDAVRRTTDRMFPVNFWGRISIDKNESKFVAVGLNEELLLYPGDLLVTQHNESLMVLGCSENKNEWFIDAPEKLFNESIRITRCIARDVLCMNYTNVISWLVGAVQALDQHMYNS
jgi:hypothetical protein